MGGGWGWFEERPKEVGRGGAGNKDGSECQTVLQEVFPLYGHVSEQNTPNMNSYSEGPSIKDAQLTRGRGGLGKRDIYYYFCSHSMLNLDTQRRGE